MKTIGKIALGIIGFIFLVTIFAPSTPDKEVDTAEVVEVVFDVPQLAGLSISEIWGVLGEPSNEMLEPTQLQIDNGLTTWENNFEKGEYELMVTFDTRTGEVIDFFMPTLMSNMDRSDLMTYEKAMNIYENANFNVEPIEWVKDPSKYTGIVVTPID